MCINVRPSISGITKMARPKPISSSKTYQILFPLNVIFVEFKDKLETQEHIILLGMKIVKCIHHTLVSHKRLYMFFLLVMYVPATQRTFIN